MSVSFDLIRVGRNAALVAALVAVCAPAFAGCHIASAEAQLCQSGIAAATAYQRLQEAREKGEPLDTATVKLLRRSGCIAAGSDYLASKVEEVARGPVLTPTGKVDVVSLRLAQNAYWYIAADSLSGTCAEAGAASGGGLSQP